MPIEVVAAAIVEDRRLLLVSKRQAPDVFYLPGGKRDADEDDLACLHRELEEELGVTAIDPVPWREVVAPAALEPGQQLRMRVFLARLGGRPAPASELARLHWWQHEDSLRLAPAIEHHVIPRTTTRPRQSSASGQSRRSYATHWPDSTSTAGPVSPAPSMISHA